jgi:hypothetical protein
LRPYLKRRCRGCCDRAVLDILKILMKRGYSSSSSLNYECPIMKTPSIEL